MRQTIPRDFAAATLESRESRFFRMAKFRPSIVDAKLAKFILINYCVYLLKCSR